MAKVVLREGQMIYVQEGGSAFNISLTIDWLELARQKTVLVDLVSKHPLLNGLVELIDYIQDTARDAGQPVVYGYTEEDWEETE